MHHNYNAFFAWAHCIKLLPEKIYWYFFSYGKVNGAIMVTGDFGFYHIYFSQVKLSCNRPLESVHVTGIYLHSFNAFDGVLFIISF